MARKRSRRAPATRRPRRTVPLTGAWHVGIDTGGTFTDIVCRRGDELIVLKVPSTREDPSSAILAGVEALASRHGSGLSVPELVRDLVHGSTVATNAILERKGASTALITTRGFRDLVEIGRQNRDALYELEVERAEPLVPRRLRLEVDERINEDGDVAEPLDRPAVKRLVARLVGRVDAVAVGLLFSYRNPDHERAIAELIRKADPALAVTLSADVSPEMREYERFSTAILNAYVTPRMSAYFDRLDERLGGVPIEIMGSGGGTIPLQRARHEPVLTVLSGPAAGVLGARDLAARVGLSKIITLDMGGTSTDVALVDGDVLFRGESRIAGHPFRIPILDVHTVGAGGGSIARVDAGGSLRVGPESAGADPGPAVYGRGDELTVTDAHVSLGHLAADSFLGGEMEVHPERVSPLVRTLARTLGVSAARAARGVLRVVNAEMERAVRVVSQERGHDPREFTLVAFGGASGLHATDLARNLLIPRVLIPPHPGMLCAWGMLSAERIRWRSKTIQARADELTATAVSREASRLVRSALADFRGMPRRSVRARLELDLRYVGQTHVVTLPCEERSTGTGRFHLVGYEERFRSLYTDRYTYADPEWPVELVTVRVALSHGRWDRAAAPRRRRPKQVLPLPEKRRAVRLAGARRPVQVGVHDRASLPRGAHIPGPAIIAEYSGTTLVPADWVADVDAQRNLVLTPGG